MKQPAHTDTVLAAVFSGVDAARSRLAASWRRSLVSHGLDPAQTQTVENLTAQEIVERREKMGNVAAIAAPKLDQLFQLVCSSGCGIALTDTHGYVLDHRFSDADRDTFFGWGLAPGANWSETAQGTNGIGTCLVEKRNVIIHRDEHFLESNTAMSCIDAPIYGAEGEIIAALDVTSARADQTEAINSLIAAIVLETARKIEADVFRDTFSKARIVDSNGSTDDAALIAVDTDDVVIGATRGARKSFGLALEGKLKRMPAADLFGRNGGPTGFEKAERAAVVRALLRANQNISTAARDLGVSRATLYRRMKRLGMTD